MVAIHEAGSGGGAVKSGLAADPLGRKTCGRCYLVMKGGKPVAAIEGNVYVSAVGGDGGSIGSGTAYAVKGPVGAATFSPDGTSIAWAVLARESDDGGVWAMRLDAPDKPKRIVRTDLRDVWIIDLAWAK
ncbi:MAG: hypothetical protein FJ087_09465 [Deltaproteobacteria bacterium]|nr:hypothetical protein [Deltaproteobacteria bacterium]